MRMVVVLPAPLGPMKPYTSPFSSFNVSRFRAYRSPYIFVRSRVSIMIGQQSKVGNSTLPEYPRRALREWRALVKPAAAWTDSLEQGYETGLLEMVVGGQG